LILHIKTLNSYKRLTTLWRIYHRLINLDRGFLTYQSWIGLDWIVAS